MFYAQLLCCASIIVRHLLEQRQSQTAFALEPHSISAHVKKYSTFPKSHQAFGRRVELCYSGQLPCLTKPFFLLQKGLHRETSGLANQVSACLHQTESKLFPKTHRFLVLSSDTPKLVLHRALLPPIVVFTNTAHESPYLIRWLPYVHVGFCSHTLPA